MIGFHLGVPQQSTQVNFQLKIQGHPDFERIDAFINFILDEEAGQYKFSPDETDAGRDFPWRYTSRLLRLAAGLQRLGQVPVFADGRIVAVRRNAAYEGTYHVRAFFPQLDCFPVSFLTSALSVADRLIKWSCQKQSNDHSLASVFELIQGEIIQPMRQFAISGVSTLPILGAAYKLTIPFWHLGNGTYLLGMGANSHMIVRSSVDSDSALGANTSNKKHLTAQLLAVAGLPTPSHVLVHTLEHARNAAETLGWPVVVKPADCERSEGVTTGLRDQRALESAFALAEKFSKNILVERHIPGVCFRLMIANRKFLYAVERRPRSLVGNGRAAIRELLQVEQASNARLPPWSRKKPLVIDDEMMAVIRAQGFELDSVPAAGLRVSLRAVESTEWGESTFDVTAQVADATIEIAERAARTLGLHNAGIDIISTDISRPWHEVGAAINEVNFRPHFGGTSAARARMQIYVEGLIPNGGRIPVAVYVGDDKALEAAHARQKQMIAAGVRAFVTTHQATFGLAGELRQFAGENTLLARCRALLVDKTVDAIILVIQTDELLREGLPVDQISDLHFINRNLSSDASSEASSGSTLLPEQIDQIVGLLETYRQ